jgi:endogenous inhibitor of DNA gyrase (YacG/DUF329 family)
MKPAEPDQAHKWVTCPHCKGASLYALSNRFRPFCCERCKQIDLGAWASEQFAVPAPAEPDELQPDNPSISG